MVIEDDMNLVELLKYELMDSGFHVSYFKSGRKTFQKLKTLPPDAIVLDILLEEGGDGRLDPEGFKRIR
ncbi:hypothetical protein KEH51_24060 [[Brevibacterium] frigoritolerans]|uniref:Response regulatory domain-containing protein n=1 Tax=Peribacillus frigoritolerans TaxID=450367 RepID=A0A941J8Q5_9BACI|nr:hypothetical protein [Peribacillus frigoritolerans]